MTLLITFKAGHTLLYQFVAKILDYDRSIILVAHAGPSDVIPREEIDFLEVP